MTGAPWTFHGGNLAEARHAYGEVEGGWVDLSTGVNPHAWPGVAEVVIDWHALPSLESLRELERVAAAYFGVDPAHVCAVPGSEMGLRLVGELLSGPGYHVGPGYGTHSAMFAGSRQVGAAAVPMLAEANLILANPNNPDGHIIAKPVIDGAIARLHHTPHWMLVDEAFADTMPEVSVVDRVADDRWLVVFRSFGKFFGLAGVRLGFVLGPRQLLAEIRATMGSWPISAGALAIGTAAYADAEWITATRARLVADAAALDAVLLRHGLVPRGACPLFRLVETGDSHELFDRLAMCGILTRPFAEDRRRLRIGLPPDAEGLARLDRALADD